MRRLVALALVVTMIGCRGEGPTAPRLRQGYGLKPSTEMDCQLYSWQCQQVQSAINYLLQHANAACQAAGAAAQARYDAMPGVAGFAPGNGTSGYDSYVIMQTQSGMPSGWGPTDGYTYIESSFWAVDALHAGALLAHEEEHQNGDDGPMHNTGKANALQSMCLNPQA